MPSGCPAPGRAGLVLSRALGSDGADPRGEPDDLYARRSAMSIAFLIVAVSFALAIGFMHASVEKWVCGSNRRRARRQRLSWRAVSQDATSTATLTRPTSMVEAALISGFTPSRTRL